MKAATVQRDQAVSLARSNQARALKIAGRIEDPWFKTQALAAVAAHANDGTWETYANRAIKAAALDPEPYRVVGASAWALSVYVMRGSREQAGRILDRLLKISERIEHDGSRCDALMLLFEAVFAFAAERDRVLEELLSVANAGASWRCGHTLHAALVTLASEDPARAKAIVERILDEKTRQRTLTKLADGVTHTPRKFH